MAILAARLAARIGSVLPNGFRTRSSGTQVELELNGRSIRSIDLTHESWTEDEQVVDVVPRAALQVLHDFQDDVIEELWTAWPSAAGKNAPAEPYARMKSNVLTAGYAHGNTVVVEFEPIEVSDLL